MKDLRLPIFGLLVVAALAVAGVLLYTSDGAEPADPEPTEEVAPHESAQLEPDPDSAPKDPAPPLPTGVRADDDPGAPADAEMATVRLASGHEVKVPAGSPAARAAQAREAARELQADALDGDDPARPGYLAPDEWSAPISREERAEIEAAFEALPEPDPRVGRADRQTSIEVARAVVEDCFRDLRTRRPGAKGRVAVAWTASASDGRGRIDDPAITLNLNLREPAFEECIISDLSGLSFPAAEDGEPLRVEYPYFFDR